MTGKWKKPERWPGESDADYGQRLLEAARRKPPRRSSGNAGAWATAGTMILVLALVVAGAAYMVEHFGTGHPGHRSTRSAAAAAR